MFLLPHFLEIPAFFLFEGGETQLSAISESNGRRPQVKKLKKIKLFSSYDVNFPRGSKEKERGSPILRQQRCGFHFEKISRKRERRKRAAEERERREHFLIDSRGETLLSSLSLSLHFLRRGPLPLLPQLKKRNERKQALHFIIVFTTSLSLSLSTLASTLIR